MSPPFSNRQILKGIRLMFNTGRGDMIINVTDYVNHDRIIKEQNLKSFLKFLKNPKTLIIKKIQ